jgi:hypothetical protein
MFEKVGDWKRHTTVVHVSYEVYRCSDCSSQKNELFKLRNALRSHLLKRHHRQCLDSELSSFLIAKTQPPPQLACAKLGCERVFREDDIWRTWMEHVGQHMEKGDAVVPGDDLIEWAKNSPTVVDAGL